MSTGQEMNEPTQENRVTTAGWATDNGRRWAAAGGRIEAQLEPIADALFEFTALAPGDRVLDVGCGRGATTRRAAVAVDPGGSVTGVDVSEDLLAAARALPATGVPIAWRLGDAQLEPLGADHHDVVISRFGVMFFDDPVAAFSNLAHTTRPDGRLVIAVWQRRDHSEIFQRPLDIAVETARQLGHTIELASPTGGAYAFGDPGYAHEVLEAAGWTDVVVNLQRRDMYIGGPGTVEEVADAVTKVGPLQTALADAPADVAAAVRDAVTAELRARHDGTGVTMEGAIAIITARRQRPS
jgi:SAM-dependent methyltransferase